MCFTINQIERACGLLLLDEFNGFVYYCKKCSCDFDSGPNLEVHILSEHQDDKETIFVNDGIFVDNTESTIIETELTDIKDEQFEENVELSELIFEESKEKIVNASTAPNERESSDEDDTPLAELFESHELNNSSNSDESTKEKNEVTVAKKRRGRPFGWRKRRNSDSDETFTLGKRSNNKLSRTKNKKINKSTGNSTDLNIKRPVGRPVGSKNKNYPEDDIPTTNTMDDVRESSNKRIGHPTIGILYCDMCPDLMFDGKMNLKHHMYQCHILQKWCHICKIRPRKSYERHMKKHHSKILYKCDICNSTLKSQQSLKTHMCLHTGEKRFLCAKCGKSFASQALYQTHDMIVHTNIKKYKCNFCDNSYHFRYRLHDHINAFHTMERPHQCDICGKGFANRNYMRIHRVTHGEAMLQCRYCDKKFKLAGNRTKHEIMIHKVVRGQTMDHVG